MGRALAEAFPEARRTFAEADEVLGDRLSRLMIEGPDAELMLTRNAQPAILTNSVAVLRALGTIDFGFAAGHSLGEWTALVAAGAIDFADAVRLVRLRGEAMQEAVPAGVGAMAAIIGLDAATADALCAEAAGGEVCTAANHNGAGQIVIAGHAAAVDRAIALAKARGVKRAVLLQVSAPFHCALMAPAAEKLAAALAGIDIRDPRVPVVANVDAEPARTAARVRENLVRQVTSPVRWEESVKRLVVEGVDRGLELGAGNVLTGLVKRIAPTLRVTTIGEPDELRAFIETPG
jgi:[acyl-carrier-protein] S-malonyltransferase